MVKYTHTVHEMIYDIVAIGNTVCMQICFCIQKQLDSNEMRNIT